ncbi:uncharacterized protein TNCV_3817231 [Trichonephila clavipes]|nr:uncharacterized protein TNCV_3817231 [Trichonephila clavipes]
MTLHSPTENSLAVLNHKIFEANSQVQNVKSTGHQTCLSINRLWHELCDMLRRLVGTTAPGHHDCLIQERKKSKKEQNSLFIEGNDKRELYATPPGSPSNNQSSVCYSIDYEILTHTIFPVKGIPDMGLRTKSR